MKPRQISILFILMAGIVCNLHAKDNDVVLVDFFTESDSTESFLTISNAFQPNGVTPQLTIFKPVYKNITGYNMVIYNRWGMLIFESSNPDKGWNGTYKGDACPVGAYVYVITYYPMPLGGPKGEKVVKMGSVTLLE